MIWLFLLEPVEFIKAIIRAFFIAMLLLFVAYLAQDDRAPEKCYTLENGKLNPCT